jgi:hypothetical protein
MADKFGFAAMADIFVRISALDILYFSAVQKLAVILLLIVDCCYILSMYDNDLMTGTHPRRLKSI